MTLTLSGGPLSGNPPTSTNYRVEGPKHRLLLHDFPRRVRAVLAGETVLDTRRGKLLHETGLLPRLYVPDEDLRAHLLEPTDHTTHCPFKGDASYWSVRAGGRVAENSVWGYLEPLEAAAWLRGHRSLYWEQMDAWFDEDEQIDGHLRDPYHRVDVRRSDRRVRVLLNGSVLAQSERPMVLSETGLPNRYYLPRADVGDGVLKPSDTRSVCPYKGHASYWSVADGKNQVADVAWSYEQPLEAVAKAAGYVCFAHEAIALEVDGEPAE